jgi:hypothetical protein
VCRVLAQRVPHHGAIHDASEQEMRERCTLSECLAHLTPFGYLLLDVVPGKPDLSDLVVALHKLTQII